MGAAETESDIPVVTRMADFDGRGGDHTAEGGGGRPAPEPQGAPREVRAVPKPFPDCFREDSLRDGGQCQNDIGSPVDMLVDTVSRIQKDMAILHEENRVLRTPATSQVVQVPRRAALTKTKVPRFDGTTSWEQYHQVFEAIVRSNSWDNDTSALQLFSHLEGDALNVAHLVPLAQRLSRSGLMVALTAHYGISRLTYMSYLTALHILLWKGTLLAQKLQNHLSCWFLIMLTPHAVIQNTTSLLEHPLARPESSLGGGLVESISDGEPAARQVPDTTLGPGVSLDGGPMEGMSCLEPLEQSILHSSWIARPRKCVMKERSEWKPVIHPAISYPLDSRPMEGITYLERSALGVSLDCGHTEGASCLEPLEQSVLSSSLAARPVEGVTEWKPVINPVMSYTLDSRLMEGNTYLERSALGCPWTVDLRRGRRVWNHWSSGFLVRR